VSLGWHIYVLTDIGGPGIDFGIPPTDIYVFQLEFTPTGPHTANSASPGQHMMFLGLS
jgi:hypothetical protein